jgi:hypothetical protein
MKYILIALLSVVLFSCKTQKSTCDAYSMNQIPFKDSIVISKMHEHYKTNDTLEIKILK